MLGGTHSPVPAFWKEISSENFFRQMKKNILVQKNNWEILHTQILQIMFIALIRLFQIGMAVSIVDDAKEFWKQVQRTKRS